MTAVMSAARTERLRMEESKNPATQEGDEVQQQARAVKARIGAIIAAVVAVASMAFGGFSFYQQVQTNESYQQVLVSESQLLAQKANDLLAQGDRYGAIETALSALPENSADTDRPLVPEAQQALENALGLNAEPDSWMPCFAQTEATLLSNPPSCVSENGWVAAMSGLCVEIRELGTGNLVSRIDVADFSDTPLEGEAPVEKLAFSEERLVYMFEDTIGCFDACTGELQWKQTLSDLHRGNDFAVSPDGSRVAVTGFVSPDMKSGKRGIWNLHLLKMSDGSAAWDLEVDEIVDQVFTPAVLGFSSDGSKIAFAHDNAVCEIDAATRSIKRGDLHFYYPTSVRYLDDYLVVASAQKSFSYVALGVFDKDFQYLWHKYEQIPSMEDTGYRDYRSIADVAGMWCLDAGDVPQAAEDAEQMIVALDRDLLFVDPKTGEAVYQMGFDTPLLACGVFPEDSGGRRIVAVTCAGDTVVSFPSKGVGKTHPNAHGEQSVGEICEAYLLEYDNTRYLSAWRENPGMHVVYREASTVDVPTELDALIAQANELLATHAAADTNGE